MLMHDQLLVQNELIFNLWVKWMKLVFDNIFSQGKWGEAGGLKKCWHNIRMGGYLMMMLDYKGGGNSNSDENILF